MTKSGIKNIVPQNKNITSEEYILSTRGTRILAVEEMTYNQGTKI
jgi:hypothetical protein